METIQTKFKISLVLILITAVLYVMPSTAPAQTLQGKWTLAKANNRHSTVLEFTKDSLLFYDFDQRHAATAYHVKGNQLAVDNGSIPIGGEFQFVNPHRLRLTPDRAKRPIDFVRLKPTKTNLTKAEIEPLKFKLTYQNRTLPITKLVVEKSGQTLSLMKRETL